MFKNLLWFIKSDIKLKYSTCWYEAEMIEGFYIISKRPFSKAYQRSGEIGLEYTYPLISLVNKSIKDKDRAIMIEITYGVAYERLTIWKGSFKKLDNLLFNMVKELQNQY